MITKERLEELIKEKTTIYRVGMCFIFDYKLDKTYYIEDNNLVQSFCEFDDDVVTRYLGTLDELFETKEEAEFTLKYKRILRTEYLDLPDWEESQNIDGFIAEFSSPNAKKLYTFFIKMDYTHNIKINKYYRGNGEHFDVFEKPLTKENYIKACEICRKLFLGEEDNDN